MTSFEKLLADGTAPREGEEKIAYEHPLVQRWGTFFYYNSDVFLLRSDNRLSANSYVTGLVCHASVVEQFVACKRAIRTRVFAIRGILPVDDLTPLDDEQRLLVEQSSR